MLRVIATSKATAKKKKVYCTKNCHLLKFSDVAQFSIQHIKGRYVLCTEYQICIFGVEQVQKLQNQK